ncbi:hypothetical protein [Halobacillus salinus]|uniref:Uncharacterized protein n=1 Tax=Halobacillus salinus TaxID=192814 RepID=A0A4Z0GWD2_9BACI|nr:hypothetical protein [Halobacillus salinus]TGB00750.1 hypothetical protein E4663_19230 [Halobacillus salinus]
MQFIYLILSAIFSGLSIFPFMYSSFGDTQTNPFSLIAFGLTGPIAVCLPGVYALISIILAIKLKKMVPKMILIICSSLFLVVNVALIVVVAMM